jgi:quinoprotein glucose dehydrogenase
MKPDGSIDVEKEEVLLEIEQPWGNHNGGTVLFGPDGMLYLSVGDGGAANDPHGAGQRLDTLLGKVLRLDVSAVGEQRPYTIPADNPFTETEGARPEIWATGLRNVWRMSFDPKTGALWAGDVGQNAWEEVDIIKRGGNYGWNEREGSHPFQPTGGDAGRFIEPVFEYGRNLGGSITGGSVYRGDLYPSMDGLYIFGDYMSGRLWAIQQNADGAFQTRDITPKDRRFPSSFGVAPDGTILMCAFSGPYQRTGRIVRLVPRAGSDISP